ncbi:MAG: DMT family transporter [Synergistaceae bacterium]|jgi:drug/metabolite transporter (DMT)-like permease|nr:DMT family transporter [Synergistaceae bacterium]
MKYKGGYHVYAVVTILCWSLAYVYTRAALTHFSAYSLGFLRYILASFILIIVAAVKKIRPPAARDIWKFVSSGAVGFFLYMITFNKGSATETAATGSVIVATAPVITAIMSAILYKEKLCLSQWAAISIEFAGILVLMLHNGVMSMGRGIPWLIVAAFSLGTFNLQQRYLTKTYTGLQSSIYSIFAGTLMLAMFAPGALRELGTSSAGSLGSVVLLGVFSSAIAYVTWSIALERAPETASVSNYMFLTPFVSSLLGFLVLSEIPDLGTVIGGAMILSGVFIFNYFTEPFSRSPRM